LTTAIIGVGNIGSTLARHLTSGNEAVVVAAKDESHAEALAQELGPLARAASVEKAIAVADAIVFAVWFDTIRELVAEYGRLLEDVVVSGTEGVAKPDPAVFVIVRRRTGHPLDRLVFVDDRADNVAAATAAGMDALVFTDAGRLRADLRERGLPV